MISYIKTILNMLLQFTFTTNFYIVIILNIIASISLYGLYKYKPKTKNLKITYLKINTLLILIYILIFIILIIKVRYEYLGNKIELLLFYEKVKEYWVIYPLILKTFIILLMVNFIFLMIQLKFFFYKQICKRFLYEYFKENKKTSQRKTKSLFVNIIDKFSDQWSQKTFIYKTTYYLLKKPYCILRKTKDYGPIKKYIYIFEFTLKHIAIIILIGVFLYDCFYNAFTLHYIFKYLPLYFFLQLWGTLTTYFYETNKLLNAILYEMYYDTNEVLYLNISENEYKIFDQYIASHLRCFTHDLNKAKITIEEWSDRYNEIISFPHNFIMHRQFVKIKNTTIFHNEYLNESYVQTRV